MTESLNGTDELWTQDLLTDLWEQLSVAEQMIGTMEHPAGTGETLLVVAVGADQVQKVAIEQDPTSDLGGADEVERLYFVRDRAAEQAAWSPWRQGSEA